MPINDLNIADPFFLVRVVLEEASVEITDKTIVLNLSQTPIGVRGQKIAYLQSAILRETQIFPVQHAVLVEGFAKHKDQTSLMREMRAHWPSAYDVRGEERLRGIGHYMSPKVWVGQFGLTIYHSATVPLNVGLHKDHDFCSVPGFREVHTQIMGFGKMQQCREKDINTLYLEEPMAPGSTHRPMYDAGGNFPWHQYETITPSVFMAVEMLPSDAKPPA
ncbi:hypothetical protein [Aliiroseovarius sp. 2305UL8-7]|uniref:hypothetical protein n=1 Tax=Aliiroseovarius conchicola TaxID=3121637 RepID=UPI003527CBD9